VLVDVVRAIDSLGKIATREQLVQRGVNGLELTAAVRRGEIWRIRRAHYATRGALPEAIAAVRVGCKLAGPSAARSYGLWSGFDERVHVALPRNASRLRTNYAPSAATALSPDTSAREIVLHWQSLDGTSECWRVGVPDVLRQMTAWTDRETAIACIDTARTILGYTAADVRSVFDSAPISDRVVSTRSRPGSDAGTESVVRQRLESCGIEVDQQVSIPGVGRVDMMIRGTRIIVEVDGKNFHSREDAFENDRRRDAQLAALGYVVIRLSFAQVFGNWARCENAILDAVSQFRNM
jgi:very-short-patch-repair endonuclease